jgi:protein-S-isoprenylcysteine O-methyltransferase Ste14
MGSGSLAETGAHHPGMGREHPYTDRTLALSLIVFFAVWIPDSLLFHVSTGVLSFIPWYVQVVLFALFEVTAGAMAGLSHSALFGKQGKDYRLLREGVFGWVRHPMYLSVLLACVGFFFGSLSLLSLVPVLCFLPVFDYLATYEETDLLRLFGAEYEEYRRTVPKWLPRPGRRRA